MDRKERISLISRRIKFLNRYAPEIGRDMEWLISEVERLESTYDEKLRDKIAVLIDTKDYFQAQVIGLTESRKRLEERVKELEAIYKLKKKQ